MQHQQEMFGSLVEHELYKMCETQTAISEIINIIRPIIREFWSALRLDKPRSDEQGTAYQKNYWQPRL